MSIEQQHTARGGIVATIAFALMLMGLGFGAGAAWQATRPELIPDDCPTNYPQPRQGTPLQDLIPARVSQGAVVCNAGECAP